MSSSSQVHRSHTASSLSSRYSCVICQQRKVRCDRGQPCKNCQKAEKPCEYKAPPPPARRARKAPVLGLHARLQRYEDLVRRLGIDPEEALAENLEDVVLRFIEDRQTRPPNLGNHEGIGNSRASNEPYSERLPSRQEDANHSEEHLWKNIQHGGLSDPDRDIDQTHRYVERLGIQDESVEPPLAEVEEDPMFMFSHQGGNIQSGAPFPRMDMRLWDMFLKNVHPMCMLLHGPTVGKMLADMSDCGPNPDPAKIALACAVCLAAINSMDSEEVRQVVGEERAYALHRFRHATQTALNQARVLSTVNVMTLQAYTLFLISSQQHYDARAIWTLVGIAVRIAQRIGLHKEMSDKHLSVLQVEVRRRLWWQIMMLDATVTGHSAATASTACEWTTLMPLNINDDDLGPKMSALPPEREDSSEMLFCLMRYQLLDFTRQTRAPSRGTPSLSEKDQQIEQLRALFEQKILRYCDPLNQLDHITNIAARSILNKLYVVNHHPRRHAGQGTNAPAEEQRLVFERSLKIIEYHNLLYSAQGSKGFLWHFNAQFLWQPLILLLNYLCADVDRRQSKSAWDQLKIFHRHHPNLVTGAPASTLYAAVGRLTLRAWARSIGQYGGVGDGLETPLFVTQLERNLVMRSEQRQATVQAPQLPTPESMGYLEQYPQLEMDVLDMEAMKWAQWDDLIGSYQMHDGDQDAYDSLGATEGMWNSQF